MSTSVSNVLLQPSAERIPTHTATALRATKHRNGVLIRDASPTPLYAVKLVTSARRQLIIIGLTAIVVAASLGLMLALLAARVAAPIAGASGLIIIFTFLTVGVDFLRLPERAATTNRNDAAPFRLIPTTPFSKTYLVADGHGTTIACLECATTIWKEQWRLLSDDRRPVVEIVDSSWVPRFVRFFIGLFVQFGGIVVSTTLTFLAVPFYQYAGLLGLLLYGVIALLVVMLGVFPVLAVLRVTASDCTIRDPSLRAVGTIRRTFDGDAKDLSLVPDRPAALDSRLAAAILAAVADC